MGHAKKVLNEDHYGLKDAKNRILEFLAVEVARSVEGRLFVSLAPQVWAGRPLANPLLGPSGCSSSDSLWVD